MRERQSRVWETASGVSRGWREWAARRPKIGSERAPPSLSSLLMSLPRERSVPSSCSAVLASALFPEWELYSRSSLLSPYARLLVPRPSFGRGQMGGDELLAAIAPSAALVPTRSRASSSFCLDEVVCWLECWRGR